MKARSFLPFPAQFLHQIADPSQASEKRVLIRSVSDPDEPVHSERRSRRYGNVFICGSSSLKKATAASMRSLYAAAIIDVLSPQCFRASTPAH